MASVPGEEGLFHYIGLARRDPPEGLLKRGTGPSAPCGLVRVYERSLRKALLSSPKGKFRGPEPLHGLPDAPPD